MDPITLATYLYANGDPVNWSDPGGDAAGSQAKAGAGPIEYTLLLAMTVGTFASLEQHGIIPGIQTSIKCVWCAAISQLEAGFFVDTLAPGVGVLGEVAGRTLCTFQVLVTTAATAPWYFAHHGKGNGSRTRTGDKHEAGGARDKGARGPSTHPKYPPRKPPTGWKGPWPPAPGQPWR